MDTKCELLMPVVVGPNFYCCIIEKIVLGIPVFVLKLKFRKGPGMKWLVQELRSALVITLPCSNWDEPPLLKPCKFHQPSISDRANLM